MPNLSQLRRQKMLEFLSKIKEEHKDDDDMLIALGEIENELTSKKYGLVWEKHEEAVDVKMRTHIPVFTEVKEREIVAAPGESYNFLLEGDNLHSLYLLEKTHKGRIDLIYIDPPYNTGNKDFTYDDKYIDEEDAFRHSKWLSFMEERLRIAQKLLADRGVIFIQISDIELANLKCLCDGIFDEDNFLNVISVNMKNIAGASGGGEDKRFKKNCEYILIYAKCYDLLPLFKGAYKLTRMSELVKQYKEESRSWKYISVLVDKGQKEYICSTVDGDGNEIKIFKRCGLKTMSIAQYAKQLGITEDEVYDYHADLIFRTTMPQSSIRPRVMEKMKEINREENVISIEYVPKTGRNKGKVYEQFYSGSKYNLFAWLSDVTEYIDGIAYKKDLQGTYWDFVAGTKNLTKEGNVEFPNGKKPVALIESIVNLFPDKDICVLDFFAGSGTTGQAVIELNQEDGGNRRFILCTNNENSICTDKTYPRLCNVINGYGKYAAAPANLKYYCTDFVSRDEEFLADELLKHITEMIQLEHGVNIDDKQYVMVLSDEEADELQRHWNEYQDIKAIYISRKVLLTTEQNMLFGNTEIHIIPDDYFEFELKEEGQAW